MIRLPVVAILFGVVTYPVQSQVPPPRPSRITSKQQANLNPQAPKAEKSKQQAKPQASKAQQSKQRVRWSSAPRTRAKAPRVLTSPERETLFKELALLEDFLEWQRSHSTHSALSPSPP